MTACPIRYQRQVPDRKGKIFYTSITSLSHISKESGDEAAHGWRRCCLIGITLIPLLSGLFG